MPIGPQELKDVDEPMLSRLATLTDPGFPDQFAVEQHTFVVYPCLSSSSDDHHLLHSCWCTGTRFGTQNKFCHYRASLVHLVSLIVR